MSDPQLSVGWSVSLRQLRPRGDPEEMFAAKMAGRRYRDGPTHDGYRDMAYCRKFRPSPGWPAKLDPEPWINLWGSSLAIAFREGDDPALQRALERQHLAA